MESYEITTRALNAHQLLGLIAGLEPLADLHDDMEIHVYECESLSRYKIIVHCINRDLAEGLSDWFKMLQLDEKSPHKEGLN